MHAIEAMMKTKRAIEKFQDNTSRKAVFCGEGSEQDEGRCGWDHELPDYRAGAL